jgi:DNA-binding CsgD family transcriptional regulator
VKSLGYLLKRAKPENVIAAVQETHKGGVPMTPGVARKDIGQFRQKAMAQSGVENLTDREREVLKLVMHGHANKTIAERLGVTVAAVNFICNTPTRNCMFITGRRRPKNSNKGRTSKTNRSASWATSEHGVFF